MPFSALPHDLWQEVADNIPLASLSTCLLVCKSLRAVALPRVFKSITLGSSFWQACIAETNEQLGSMYSDSLAFPMQTPVSTNTALMRRLEEDWTFAELIEEVRVNPGGEDYDWYADEQSECLDYPSMEIPALKLMYFSDIVAALEALILLLPRLTALDMKTQLPGNVLLRLIQNQHCCKQLRVLRTE